jgi:hypothetical protein
MKLIRFFCLMLLVDKIVLAQSSHLASGPENGVSQPNPTTQGKIIQRYGKLPLSFEANEGQTDARVKFLSRGSGYTLFLTSDEAVFSSRGRKTDNLASGRPPQLQPGAVVPKTNAVLRMKLVNANRAAKVTGTNELPGKSNYFIGSDPKKWHSRNVPTWKGAVTPGGPYPYHSPIPVRLLPL